MYSFAIRNGFVIDGSGKPGRKASVYLDGEKIALITEDASLPAEKELDAEGLAVTPGFIDMHTHSDSSPYIAPGFESYVHQGVTTSMAGNCGGSLVPNTEKDHDSRAVGTTKKKFKDYLTGDRYTAHDVASYAEEITGICANNVGTFVGHGALRSMCMADPKAAVPTAEELEAMKAILEEQLKQGAFGLSFGLVYVPGKFSQTEELIELAKVVAKYDGLMPFHMRSESDKMDGETMYDITDALNEVRRIAEESGARVHISHFKVMYPRHDDIVDRLLAMIDDMKEKGIRITFDQYPYEATSTGFGAVLPKEYSKLSTPEVIALYKDDARFEEIRPYVKKSIDRRFGADHIGIAFTGGKMPEADGKTIADVAKMLNVDETEAFRQFIIRCLGSAQAIYYAMYPEDVRKIMKRAEGAIVSDGNGMDMVSKGLSGVPHPRNCNSNVRFLRLVREEKLMPLETAVYKMTGRPAEILQLKDRGILKEGNFADITVFDPETVRDNGTFEKPGVVCTGIRSVILNGQTIWENGASTGVRSGKGLLRK